MIPTLTNHSTGPKVHHQTKASRSIWLNCVDDSRMMGMGIPYLWLIRMPPQGGRISRDRTRLGGLVNQTRGARFDPVIHHMIIIRPSHIHLILAIHGAGCMYVLYCTLLMIFARLHSTTRAVTVDCWPLCPAVYTSGMGLPEIVITSSSSFLPTSCCRLSFVKFTHLLCRCRLIRGFVISYPNEPGES